MCMTLHKAQYLITRVIRLEYEIFRHYKYVDVYLICEQMLSRYQVRFEWLTCEADIILSDHETMRHVFINRNIILLTYML